MKERACVYLCRGYRHVCENDGCSLFTKRESELEPVMD